MIVVDANVISYFWLDVSRTELAQEVRRRDSGWQAPRLWRSEFRNVLAQHIWHRGLPAEGALQIMEEAEADLASATRPVRSDAVLRLAARSQHAAYDCEYVALARDLGCQLVTGDTDLAEAFPDTAILMEDFVAGGTE